MGQKNVQGRNGVEVSGRFLSFLKDMGIPVTYESDNLHSKYMKNQDVNGNINDLESNVSYMSIDYN